MLGRNTFDTLFFLFGYCRLLWFVNQQTAIVWYVCIIILFYDAGSLMIAGAASVCVGLFCVLSPIIISDVLAKKYDGKYILNPNSNPCLPKNGLLASLM